MEGENATYKLERFEVFLVSVPAVLRSLTYAVVVTALLGLLTVADGVGSGYDSPDVVAPLAVALLAATLIGGEAIRWIVQPYPRSWGYFLALVNHVLATGVLVVCAVVPAIDLSTAVALAAGFMALNGVQVLIITLSLRRWPHSVFASLIQPAAFVVILDMLAVPLAHTPRDGVLFGTAVAFVVGSMWLAERMVAVNVDVRGLDFSSALTLDRELDMGIGERTRRWVQTVRIESERATTSFVVPWFHPGLMSRIGGGRMSRDVTSALDAWGGGSYLKPPASHKSDPAAPAAIDEIIETAPEPSRAGTSTATRLVELERDSMVFRARGYGDLTVVWFDSPAYDDVELPVYAREIEPETQVVIDCHATEAETARNLKADTVDADRFRDCLTTVADRVAEEEQHPYEAGFASFDTDVPGFAFFERVANETTLVVGLDGNNVTQEYHDLANDLAETYDHVLLLTTDTHASPFEIDALPPIAAALEAIDEAEVEIAPASIGLAAAKTDEVTVLNDSYTKLIDSFNIGARFLIASLGLSYVFLVVVLLLS